MASQLELAHWRDFWGDLSDRPNPYGTRNQIYTEGYHRGEDISNGGQAERVPALRAGTIIDSGVSGMIGPWIAVLPDKTLLDRPERDIYCHMSKNGLRTTGRIGKAKIVGSTIGWDGEFGGTAWRGPHLHFVVAANSHGGFDVDVVDYDPRPIIAAALAGEFDPAPRPAGTVTSAVRSALGLTQKDVTMINIYNKDDKNEETRRAAVGEDTFEVQGPGASTIDRRFWGRPLNVNQAEWNRALAGVNKRRAQKGLKPLKGIRGEI